MAASRAGTQGTVSLHGGCRLASKAGESPDNNHVGSLAFKGERSHGSQGRETRPSKKRNFTLMAPFITRFLIRKSSLMGLF